MSTVSKSDIEIHDPAGLFRGKTVLIVEDDYFLATDLVETLETAGAVVAGPFADESDAYAALQAGPVTAAAVDVNLGHGPSFVIARELRRKHIPFVFMTGYDELMIEPEFRDVPRVSKPFDPAELLRCLIAEAHTPDRTGHMNIISASISAATKGLRD